MRDKMRVERMSVLGLYLTSRQVYCPQCGTRMRDVDGMGKLYRCRHHVRTIWRMPE